MVRIVARQANRARTLEQHRHHQNTRNDEENVVLGLASRREPEVLLANIERVVETVHVILNCVRVLAVEHLLKLLRDVLSGLLAEDVRDVLVKEIVLVVVRIRVQSIHVVRQVVHAVLVDGPNSESNTR